ncbi:hypothetical protein GIB67_013976 [Kingdonia uniflora]|uniref:Uncharacterized protein n=1 Tax=Kingdonia uniflora TaxID=39325 RepID=A0A7J7LDH8_9MAGN|nr:hypothetical protein GIB67_013976 [Kingdonia uniflora]
MWKGKIEKSMVEECREAYAHWLNHAHELLKQRSLTKQNGPTDIIQNDEVQPKRHDKSSVVPETIHVPKNLSSQLECSSERGTGHLTIILLLTRAPQVHLVFRQENINGNGNNVRGRAKDVAWLEKRVYQLKDEMFIIEARLEKMQHEHALLKSYLKGLELLK